MKMGDLELSLDDIIKKKLGKTGPGRGRGNLIGQRKGAGITKRLSDQGKRAGKSPINNKKNFGNPRLATTKNARPFTQGNVTDARLKIIQNQRLKITDAREKLGQIAKQTDARLRLMSLRVRKEGRPASQLSRIQDHIRSGIPDDQLIQRSIRGRIGPPSFEDELMDYSDEIAFMSRSFADRAAIDPDSFGSQYRGRIDAPLLYRTVENDLSANRMYNSEQGMYPWLKKRSTSPIIIDDIDIPKKRLNQRFPGTLRSDERQDNNPSWDIDEPPIVITKKVKPIETVGILKRSSHDHDALRIIKDSPPPMKRGPTRTLSERFCQDGNSSAEKIIQLKAKLEANQLQMQAAAATRADSTSAGHRIVVSNLVHSVTHEDVKELFEDIGELISSKVVRPGIAEVVYKQHKDAVEAVDVYHNRQLDGQPMKCLLVNNRSALPASKMSKTVDRKAAKSLVELDMTAFRKALHKKSTS